MIARISGSGERAESGAGQAPAGITVFVRGWISVPMTPLVSSGPCSARRFRRMIHLVVRLHEVQLYSLTILADCSTVTSKTGKVVFLR